MTISTQMPVLQVDNLTIDYRIDSRWQKAINDFEITLHPGQIYGIVGESGSGKSTVIQGIMHYLSKNGRISAGSVLLNDENLVPKKRRQMRHLWGSQMHMVPQNPFTALNPSMRVGEQIAELIRLHKADNGHSTNEQVYDLLTMVRLADPLQIAQRYPHELSGGQQQRVVLAMAVATSPQILLLDEPTTSLDVTTEATILDLIRDLVNRTDAGAIFVTHNLGVVAQMCERVTVMYGGEIMEDAAVADLYRTPLHPYTIGLLACIPKFGDSKYNRALRTIPGSPPSIAGRSHACVFSDRCPVAKEICFTEKPPLDILKDNRKVRCHRWQEIATGELVVAQAYEDGIEIRVEDEDETILKVESITKHFDVPLDVMDIFDKLQGKAVFNKLQAVDNVNLSIQRGHTLGLVGESGSGKSTLARVIMGLTDRTSGNIDLLGIDIRNTVEARRLITLSHLQMIFQNPEDSLNPYMRVGDAIARPLITLNRRNPIRDWMDSTTPSPFLRYGGMIILRTLNFFIGLALLIVDMVGVGNQTAKERAKELLKDVNLDESYMNRFPNQLSGGEKQRVAIARAFASSPELIVCDEPVSSLDVSVQAAVLNLLAKLQQENDTAYLFISHDLAVVGYLADYLAVMYLGEIFEVGYGSDLFAPPYHPYTEALLSAIPVPDPTHQSNQIRLSEDIPSPQHLPSGCRFHTRCPRKIGAICEAEIPPWRDDGNGHYIRCHIPIDELTELQAVPNNDHEEG